MSRVERDILVQKFHKSGSDLTVERFHPIIDVFGSEFHPFSKRFLRFQPIVGRFKVEWGHSAWGEERFHPRGHFQRGHFAWGEERFHPIIGHLGSKFHSIVEDFGDYQDLGSLDGVSDSRGGSELFLHHRLSLIWMAHPRLGRRAKLSLSFRSICVGNPATNEQIPTLWQANYFA